MPSEERGKKPMRMREAMDRVLEEAFARPGTRTPSGHPRDGVMGFVADLMDRGDRYVLWATLDGVEPDSIDIAIQGQSLVIRGEIPSIKVGTGDRWLLRERQTGAFERSFRLPSPIDAESAEAEFMHGVLRLTMPKVEIARGHRIPINRPPARLEAQTQSRVDPSEVDPTKPVVDVQPDGPSKARPPRAKDTNKDDLVSAESESSFPASDPPSWTPERT
jgi:HSP20 family protein